MKDQFGIERLRLAEYPLPQYGESYAVIPHDFVAQKAISTLESKGLAVSQESYRACLNGNVVQGNYYIRQSDDELGMLFSWTNSYNKSLRFRCSMGAYVLVCLNGMVGSIAMTEFGRKHTGTAKEEAEQAIVKQIEESSRYYQLLIEDKQVMKRIRVPEKLKNEILGSLFFENEILTSEQMNIIKNQFNKPSFDYKSPKDSLWTMYNHITFSLRRSHPSKWLTDQRFVHGFICDTFNINQEPVSQGHHQITLHEMIADVEKNGH